VPPSRTVVDSPRKRHAIDDAIEAIPAGWFRAAPAVYWADFLASTAAGWIALFLTVVARGWERVAFLTVAVFALYRAVLFIHEITHRARRDVPRFALAWNVLVGVPLLIPSFLYEGVHTDHHRQSSYGTRADPEYVPFGRQPPTLILTSALALLLTPVALAVRFGILAPLSWVIPPLRRHVWERCSALAINHRYIRRVAITRAGRAQEAGAFVFLWSTIGLWWIGVLPAAAFVCWFIVSAAVSGINLVRTLAAHRYDQDSGELSMTEQLLDSCTIAATGGPSARLAGAVHALFAPVGLRYHALHHWIPSLPYHNLGRAHRLLVSSLRADAPYHATVEQGFAAPLRDLLDRARAHSR
jgi:fatty acid desaturase